MYGKDEGQDGEMSSKIFGLFMETAICSNYIQQNNRNQKYMYGKA